LFKIVPRDIELTPLTCRQWYIGDGSLNNNASSITLATCGFLKNDVLFLSDKLNMMGFKNTIQPCSNCIHISKYSTKDFLNYIGKCPIDCYQHKWAIKGDNK